MQDMTEEKFLSPQCTKLYEYFNDDDKLLDYLEAYRPEETPWQIFKKG
jgi:hypothetical protein